MTDMGADRPVRVRFAPSPSGYLHVGNARTALFNWLFARRHGGQFVLRIEDTDAERSSQASVDGILEDLRWLQLDWDEGPEVGGPFGPYRQAERGEGYRAQAERLLRDGAAYLCFCSPERLQADRQEALSTGRPVRYPGRCRNLAEAESRQRLAAGERAAVRFRVPDRAEVGFTDLVRGRVSFPGEVIGDAIIVRADGSPAYNFAVVVDDASMHISHVLRGEDHISNTPRQLLLYDALGWVPPRFAHLALVQGSDHTPLAKRHGATSVREFRDRGVLPEALSNYLALLGWSPGDDREIVPREDLVRCFAIEDVGRSASVFDEEKLAWMNRQYLRDADRARLTELSLPFLLGAGFVTGALDASARGFLQDVVPPVAAAVDRLDQVPGRLGLLFRYDLDPLLDNQEARAELADEQVRTVVEALVDELESTPRLTDRDRFREVAARVRQRTGCKGRALFHPIRLALTGAGEGPELDWVVPALERGAELGPGGLLPILGCLERARRFRDALAGRAKPS